MRLAGFVSEKKDYVTKVKVQKRLLLCTIKEIYIEVKSKFPNAKIGFSTFWQLKPKWCVTLLAIVAPIVVFPNTYLQSIKLMLTVIDISLYSIDLDKMFISDINNRDCMTAKCDSCPGFSEVKTYLAESMVKSIVKSNFYTSSNRRELTGGILLTLIWIFMIFLMI